MDLSQVMRQMIRNTTTEQAKSLELRVGQLVRGVVMQLLQDQEALIQIDGMTVRAKLEVPLQQGQATLLQVQPETTGGLLVLKPVDSPHQQLSDVSLANLLKSLRLKDDDMNRLLIQLLRREGIELNANHMRMFRGAVDSAPTQVDASKWLQSAAIAYHKGLPLTQANVNALYQTMHGPALSTLQGELATHAEQWLRSSDPSSTSSAARQLVEQLMRTLGELRTTVHTQLSSNQANQSGLPVNQQNIPQPAAQQTQQTQAAPVSQVTSAGSQQPMLAVEASPAAPLQANSAPAANAQSQQLTQMQSVNINNASSQLGTATQSPQPVATTQTQAPPPLAPVINHNTEQASQQQAQPAQLANRASEAVVQSSHSTVAQQEQANSNWINQLLKQLGLETERSWLQLSKMPGVRANQLVLGKHASIADPNAATTPIVLPDGSSTTHPSETLKTVLMQMLNSDELPVNIREAAQQTLNQITGQQLLLTSDRQSAFTQLTLLIPMSEHGDQQAAIHIQSRKKGNEGAIDAANCRLVFDLALSDLGDTLIDVQVVDSTVSIRVNNDHPLMPVWMGVAKDNMYEALEDMGYRCTVWKCEPFPIVDENTASAGSLSVAQALPIDWSHAHQSYKGVDMRI